MGYRSTVKFLIRKDDYEKLIEFSKTSEAPKELERLLAVDRDIDDK